MVIPDVGIYRIFLANLWKMLIKRRFEILQIIRKHVDTVMRDMSEASPRRATSGQRYLEYLTIRPPSNGNLQPW